MDKPNYGSMKLKRGYWGIGLWHPKLAGNVGGVLRNAHCFGADFVMILGKRYSKDRCDVTSAASHVPVFHFEDENEFFERMPLHCTSIAVEITDEANSLYNLSHPKQALYFFGPEDGSLPPRLMDRCDHVVRIPTLGCLNLSVASAIVCWDRGHKLHCKGGL